MSRDHQRCLVALSLRQQQFQNLLAVTVIQRRSRLVGQDQAGIVDHRPGDRHPLALAVAELMGIGVYLVGDLQRLQHFHHPLTLLGQSG